MLVHYQESRKTRSRQGHRIIRDRCELSRSPRRLLPLLPLLPILLFTSCGPTGQPSRWRGTIDTLPSGAILVSNPATGLWDSSSAWRVTEDLRLGEIDAEGPEQFGEIRSIAVDEEGRIYVLDEHAQEIRVFGADGLYVRTIGREGGGPGELRRAMVMLFDPDGHLRVLDPQNNRISVFDSAGTYLDGLWMAGSFFTSRWPGGYDDAGYFYHFLPDFGGAFRFVIVRMDSALNALDTIRVPEYEAESFDYTSPDGNNRLRTGVPFAPFLVWVFEPGRAMWEGVNDRYRIVERSVEGDTLRIIERAWSPVPVTGLDRDSALEGLEWFVREGGKIDPSRLRDTKPAYQAFFLDAERNLWVLPFTVSADQGRVADVFDPDGRYLGRVALPFAVERSPWPVITDRHLYAVTEDELGVQYVARGEIQKPGM